MKVALFGSTQRAEAVLRALLSASVDVPLCVYSGSSSDEPFSELATAEGIAVFGPQNPNADPEFLEKMRELAPDVLLSVAYHHLLTPEILECCKECINFHAGDLSRFKGSSPMNWALADGESVLTISACRMDAEIDSGDIVKEKALEISVNSTISDLHELATSTYADFALEIVSEMRGGGITPMHAPSAEYRYCSRRFPDDSLVLWDTMSAWEVHNLIRASSSPYGGAISFLDDREVRLWRSVWTPEIEIRTAPGRICRITENGIYVGARDRALLITEASYFSRSTNLINAVDLYDKFQTMGDFLLQHLRQTKTSYSLISAERGRN